jgi:redox-sensitive bicupin YhaK (pirin superfamily)
MITLRGARERGFADHGWLKTYHTFSFADYYDSRHMGFRKLRVINEDRVEPRRGFGTHSHRDMEIITYVLEGTLAHEDDMGNGSVISPGDVQRMSAGTGVRHSEYNPSQTEVLHFLQIWILPEQENLPPTYEQRQFGRGEKLDRLCLVGSRDGRNGSVTIHQDADLYAAVQTPHSTITYPMRRGRHAWVQVMRGSLTLNGIGLSAGDGAAVSQENELRLSGETETEYLLFDLP